MLLDCVGVEESLYSACDAREEVLLFREVASRQRRREESIEHCLVIIINATNKYQLPH